MPPEVPAMSQPPAPHLAFQRSTPIKRGWLHLSFGNLLEIAGAGLGCYATYRLVGLSWALVVGAVCLLIAAEWVYDVSTVHVPLPRKPHPIVRFRAIDRRRKLRHSTRPTKTRRFSLRQVAARLRHS